MKSWKKWTLDKTAIIATVRTSASLLLGNSIVVPVLTEFKSRYWWILLVLALFIMIVTNIKDDRSSK